MHFIPHLLLSMLRFLACVTTLLASAQTPGRVASHGIEIHYRIFGKGAPLLILGGGPGDVADRYLGLAELLGRHAQCILVEQRGTGKSTPKVKDASTLNVACTLDDFESIRTQLGLKQWSVLGFSYGGYLASLYAEAFPDSLSSMVLLGSMGLNWEGNRVFEDNVMSRLNASDQQSLDYWKEPARMKADPQRAITETIRAMMPGYFFDRKKALLASQEMKPSDFDFELGEWIYKDTVDRKLDLAKLPVRYQSPVLVLHGRQDPTGESVPQALARHYAKSRLRFIERCGHYSWMEHPEKVLAAVAEFLTPPQQSDALGHAWTLIPAGAFRMGSPESLGKAKEIGKADERPQHRVELSHPFLMGTTPVTVGQFRRFVKASGYRTTAEIGTGAWVWNGVNDWVQKGTANWLNPGFPQTEDHPVVCVSWNDAQAYCVWLSKQSGSVCRLPTEAEFEYVQRACTSSPWFFGTDPKGFEAFGWPQSLTPQGFPTHPVRQKRANPWGLHDMVGNVWQWCVDWYGEQSYSTGPALNPRGPADGGARVNRGGMGDNPESWRSAARDSLPPDYNYSNQGFRVVRELVRNQADGHTE